MSRLALLVLVSTLGCATAQPRPAACASPAESVEVAQIQVGWNALDSGIPQQLADILGDRPITIGKFLFDFLSLGQIHRLRDPLIGPQTLVLIGDVA